MKNILVPTDFSPLANSASEYALKIAQKAKAEIHFLHILWTPVDWVKLDLEKEKNYPETLKQIGHAKNELNQWKKQAEDLRLKVRIIITFDTGRDEIIKHVSSYHHDFVVMGSHGASGARETFIGSNAQKIIRNATVPVLVIKEKPPRFPMKSIVFASSFEEDVKEHFHNVVDFADLMESDIHLVYINTMYNFEESETSEAKMQNFLEHCPRGGTCSINIYNAMDEERGIRHFAKRQNADMIAITTHGKTGFLGMMSKSIAESLVNHAETSILSMNLKNQ